MERRKTESAASVPKTRAKGALQKTTKSAPERQEDKPYLTFGIGCFHFASLRPANEITREKYFQDLKEYFLSDKLVVNFEIDSSDITSVFAEERPENITENIYESEIIYPYVRNCLIRFEIHVPKRVQKEYILSWREPTANENFVVEIDYSEDIPVTYVWLDADEPSPSTAVSILWKHLKSSNPESKAIKFQMTGPSPFHTNFVVRKTNGRTLDISIKEKRGYDQMTIVVPDVIEESDVKEIVRYRLNEEFSIFYEASIDRVRFHNDFSLISDKIEKTINKESLRDKIKRMIVGGDPEIYDISIEIEKIMINLERMLSGYKEKLSYIEKSFGEIINKSNIEDRLSEIGSVPLERYLSIISILRSRHESSRANYTVIIAAIVGAAAALLSSKIF